MKKAIGDKAAIVFAASFFARSGLGVRFKKPLIKVNSLMLEGIAKKKRRNCLSGRHRHRPSISSWNMGFLRLR